MQNRIASTTWAALIFCMLVFFTGIVSAAGLTVGQRTALAADIAAAPEFNAVPHNENGADTIEINSIDATGFHAYTSGGILQYRTPGDLSVYTNARDTFKARAGAAGSNKLRCSVAGTSGATKPTGASVDGSVTWVATTNPTTVEWTASTAFAEDDVIDTLSLMFCSVDNGRIEIDNAAKTITYLISANDTSLIDWKRAVHELEMIAPGATFVDDEVVSVIPVSKVSVVEESTT